VAIFLGTPNSKDFSYASRGPFMHHTCVGSQQTLLAIKHQEKMYRELMASRLGRLRQVRNEAAEMLEDR
jgi:hypothetical protein